MQKQLTAVLLALALSSSLLSMPALAAETADTGAAADSAVQAGDDTGSADPADIDATETPVLPPDAAGTVSFANLSARVRESNLTLKMLDESIASINAVDFDKMYDDLRKNLNQIARTQRYLLMSGAGEDNYTYSTLQTTYNSLKDSFEDMKDGKIQDDYAAAKRQLENAENQVVIGAESLYVALLELQNTRASVQRTVDALDRSVKEMELRYSLGQISALTLQQVKNGRTQAASGLSTLDMNLENLTRQLENMLGVEQTGTLTLGETPAVSAEAVAQMDYDAALASAKAKSYTLFAADRDLEDAKESYDDTCTLHGHYGYMAQSAAHTLQAAQYTHDAAVESFELSFRTMFTAVADYQQVLTAAESALSLQKNTYASTELKYRQGTISQNALLDAKDTLATAETAVVTAQHNLFTAYHTYLWAVDYGILN